MFVAFQFLHIEFGNKVSFHIIFTGNGVNEAALRRSLGGLMGWLAAAQ